MLLLTRLILRRIGEFILVSISKPGATARGIGKRWAESAEADIEMTRPKAFRPFFNYADRSCRKSIE